MSSEQRETISEKLDLESIPKGFFNRKTFDPAESNTLPEQIRSDHVSTRNFSRSHLGQPEHFLHALNKFELFQGAHTFLQGITRSLFCFVPGQLVQPNNSYICLLYTSPSPRDS
eukprot:TRINITY_DN1315_c0_g1_i9.p1 TRINITY_DN1315_c0_g1~~TRINITY_DN1315_c0_g1_i9.p1  ORF type:complete len:114 (+),score=33.40 TRINITY_DN1315_c0_g1_i9:128-469(+)